MTTATDDRANKQTLENVLGLQLQAAEKLADILDSEAVAIKNRDAESLTSIAPEKLASLKTLEDLEQARQRLDAIDASTNPGLKSNRLWEQVLDVIRVCDRKNQVNGVMLSLRQEHIQRAMDLIADRDAAQVTYAPDGSTKTTSGQLGPSVSV